MKIDSKILDHENISKNTVLTLLNKLVRFDQDNNESILSEYINKNNIKLDSNKIMYNLLISNKRLSNI